MAKGYLIAQTNKDMLSLNPPSGKVIAINPILDGAALNYELDRSIGELALSDFLRKDIEVLPNPKGYFLMVE